MATTVTTCSELEDELIHYSHGRHIEKSERASTPQSHKARSVQEYLRVFENLNANGVAQSYRYLCDITHPGAPSVWMWLAPMDTKGSEFVLSTDQDETIIESFLELYERVVLDVLMFAFNADGLAAWTKCRNELEQRGARLQAVKH